MAVLVLSAHAQQHHLPAIRPCKPTMPMAAVTSANMALGSLVFDCEVEEGAGRASQVCPPVRSREQLTREKEKLTYFSAPSSTFAGKLLRDVRYFGKEERDTDAILLATKLSAVGYSVNVRTALGGGSACFRNLRHEFLTVRGRGDFEGVEFIVEPRFREHFTIPHPTDEYSEVLSVAPDVFVGTSARLVPIVQTLCSLMADSFEAKSLTLPPWRRTQSMLSKWLPNRQRDSGFSRASAPPHEDPDRRYGFGGGNGYGGGDGGGVGGFMADAMGGWIAGGGGSGFLPAANGGVLPPPLPLPGQHRSGSPFARNSDPLSVQHWQQPVQGQQQQQAQGPQQQQQQAQGPQQQQQCGLQQLLSPLRPPQLTQPMVDAFARDSFGSSPEATVTPGGGGSSRFVRRQDSGYAAAGFVPFGGRMDASDNEGPSPPAPGVLALPMLPSPTLQGPQHAQHHQQQQPQQQQQHQHVHGARRPQSSLLAARLQEQAAGGAAAAAAMQTRPPAHWGEAPIHKVRMGFNVPPATAAPGGCTAATAGPTNVTAVATVAVAVAATGASCDGLLPEPPAVPQGAANVGAAGQ